MKFIKEAVPYVLILIGVITLRTYIITPVIVSGNSMNDTLSDGDVLLLKKYDKTYTRGEIIVFNYQNSKLVKRIIGLPGEKISYIDGKLYINEIEVYDEFSLITHDFDLNDINYDVIPEGYYFVLGDNRNKSSDSRIIGLVNEEQILGTTSFSMIPFKSIK